ncbi:hypothetical protein [Microcoleus sp. Pol10D4]|uniref:hypothetical protein n=1 Tax=Microcoleus sp. Pol10D4 TaxID=3055387 RepID=UPI002FD36BBF
MGVFKNAPQFPEAELEIGDGVRLGCCLTIALTPNRHIQLNITQHKPIAFNSTLLSTFASISNKSRRVRLTLGNTNTPSVSRCDN